jgi:RNA recognition motif-containing protein
MGKKLYVGNLAFSVNDAALGEMFAACGVVESAKVITDRSTGQSKGFGFVEMTTEEEAQEAIKRLNGSDVSGRALNVSEAKPQAPRENRGGFGGSDRGGGGFGNKRSFGRRF